jgi:nucleotide-binding universal stress UspA family protein
LQRVASAWLLLGRRAQRCSVVCSSSVNVNGVRTYGIARLQITPEPIRTTPSRCCAFLQIRTLESSDLLAVGQKGRMATAGMGSMARSLIKQAPCPVLMASGDLRPIMRILAAFDGSESSRKAVRFARDLAKAADLPLNVLSVGGVTWSADETLLAAQEVAGDAQVLAVGPGDEPEADQILRVAQHAGLAMIVMGAFPDSWMHQLFFGGTTSQVLRNLNAPVIVIH